MSDAVVYVLSWCAGVENGASSPSLLEPVVYHLRFASAFLASISMIIVSEFGDKTFFIAAIMAMRNSRLEGEPHERTWEKPQPLTTR